MNRVINYRYLNALRVYTLSEAISFYCAVLLGLQTQSLATAGLAPADYGGNVYGAVPLSMDT